MGDTLLVAWARHIDARRRQDAVKPTGRARRVDGWETDDTHVAKLVAVRIGRDQCRFGGRMGHGENQLGSFRRT